MLTAEQLRAARAILRLEQKTLAERAGVSVETIKSLAVMPTSRTSRIFCVGVGEREAWCLRFFIGIDSSSLPAHPVIFVITRLYCISLGIASIA